MTESKKRGKRGGGENPEVVGSSPTAVNFFFLLQPHPSQLLSIL